MARRSVRKLTVWHPEEWRRIEDAARLRRLAPLRFVREAALHATGTAEAPAPPRRRRRGDVLVHQLARVLNNLQQLRRVAEEDGDESSERIAARVILATEEAIAAAPVSAREALPLARSVRAAGLLLNEVAHRAHIHEAWPDDAAEAFAAVYVAVRACLP